jgi:hypothetical protein
LYGENDEKGHSREQMSPCLLPEIFSKPPIIYNIRMGNGRSRKDDERLGIKNGCWKFRVRDEDQAKIWGEEKLFL